jgi:non-specific serine/threonine protein kinase
MAARTVRSAPERFAFAVSPHGRVVEDPSPPEDSSLDGRLAAGLRQDLARDDGDARALIDLAARHPSSPLPPTLAFFRDLGRALLASAAAAATGADPPPPPPPDLDFRALASPPMLGREYLGGDVLRDSWRRMGDALRASVAASGGSLDAWLHARHEAWAVVGRVCFHLAENKRDPASPFAFLATYSIGMSSGAKVQHRPLGQALAESAATKDKAALLRLLLPVNRAAENSKLVKEMVDDSSVFRPLAWTPSQAHRFLRDVPAMEAAGLVVRVPDWWRPASPPRVTAQVTIGSAGVAGIGADGLLQFSVGLSLDGEPLTDEEWSRLRAAGSGLVALRGRWVEVDRERLEAVLGAWTKAQRAAREGIPFHQAMRLLAGAERPAGVAQDEPLERSWTRVTAGPWLAEVLARLRGEGGDRSVLLGEALHATLRPYQVEGVRWLTFLNELQLGGCLADDMGLGKTIQVLALLLVLKQRGVPAKPHLLVAPASLLANWRSEAARFTPSLVLRIAHASGDGLDEAVVDGADLVVTTYGALASTPWLREREWDTLVLDEAQAIKNPGAKQTRAAKSVPARVRLTLTGTPVENRAGDLFSLFDFLQPGLLGTAAEFRRFVSAAAKSGSGWAPLRALVAPYILRRMKTDPLVAPDLPAKTVIDASCGLSREQAVLYQRAVDELRQALDELDGMSRRGAVLATLTRLKQICNHPSHWLGDGGWEPERSGKLLRLAELVEPIAQRQEKALVFTQFREAVDPLAASLADLFGREGLVLHGGTAVRARQEVVKRFQEDDALPFLVLSLKAGGTGLNLTAATHVIHFDRWWNPAVEDQATDRAFRIGQTRGVMVHVMTCRGTVEERVDEMIRQKRGLAKDLLGGEAEVSLTELGDAELMRTLSLDLARARVEA